VVVSEGGWERTNHEMPWLVSLRTGWASQFPARCCYVRLAIIARVVVISLLLLLLLLVVSFLLLRHSLLLARHFPPPPPRSLAVSLSGPRALATLVEFVPLPISRGPHLHPPTDAHPSRRGGVRARMGCCEDQPTSPTRWRGIILGGHLPTSLNGGEGRRWWWWWRVVAAATRRVVGNDGGGGDDEAGGGW
jgi:hypothetical protein